MNPDDCLFCSIINGDIPSHKIYEDEHTYAFLDINPVSDGHLLVIPKQHAEQLTELGGDATSALFRTVRNVAEAVETGLDPDGLNLLQNNGEAAGQEIKHVHVHIIPRYANDGFDFSFDSTELDDDRATDLVRQVQDRLGE